METNTDDTRLLGVSALARALGCGESTIRDLDRRGVLKAVRDSANRRLFTSADIERGRMYFARHTQDAA